MTDLNVWLAEKEERDRRLYERYGKPLEREHRGQYVAISPDGQTITGDDDVEVLREAIERFGSGNFAFHRVGHRAVDRWLNLSP